MLTNHNPLKMIRISYHSLCPHSRPLKASTPLKKYLIHSTILASVIERMQPYCWGRSSQTCSHIIALGPSVAFISSILLIRVIYNWFQRGSINNNGSFCLPTIDSKRQKMKFLQTPFTLFPNCTCFIIDASSRNTWIVGLPTIDIQRSVRDSAIWRSYHTTSSLDAKI